MRVEASYIELLHFVRRSGRDISYDRGCSFRGRGGGLLSILLFRADFHLLLHPKVGIHRGSRVVEGGSSFFVNASTRE